MGEKPRTQYARNGDVHLAFQVVGEGALDLLLIDTWVHHVEAVWDFPDFARLLRRLSSLGRLIHFDRRGTGLSDPVPLDQLPDLQTQVGDAVAVLKAAGSDSAAVIGLNDGTAVAVLLAAAHPELCRSLVLYTLTSAHTLAAGLPMESIEEALEMIQANAVTDDSWVGLLAPSRVGDERFDQQLARFQRFSVRPGAWAHYYRQTMKADVADVLPLIRTPTLVLNRTGNPIVPVEQSRVAAAAIEGAKFVELPGTDHLAFSQGIDGLVDEVEEFLTGARTGADPDRMLTTLLFTDIVNSTTLAASWATSAGATCSTSTTSSAAASWRASAAGRSQRRGTASSRPSTVRWRRCGAPLPWWRRWGRCRSRSAPASIPGRSKCAEQTWEGWLCTSRPGLRRSPATVRCWSPAR